MRSECPIYYAAARLQFRRMAPAARRELEGAAAVDLLGVGRKTLDRLARDAPDFFRSVRFRRSKGLDGTRVVGTLELAHGLCKVFFVAPHEVLEFRGGRWPAAIAYSLFSRIIRPAAVFDAGT